MELEEWLDRGHGKCLMLDPTIADIVLNTICHFDTERYWLLAVTVMPNHVHAIIQPFEGFDLHKILHSWKSFSANEINRIKKRRGKVWQTEYYDHVIRNDNELSRAITYVLENPSNAGLKNWKWVYLADEFR